MSTFDAYPMPQIETLLDIIGGTQVLSTIDLTESYWQIPLALVVWEKTAVATPSGHYHFINMSFGLYGAAASCQRDMDKALKDVWDCAVTYINDILVFSCT